MNKAGSSTLRWDRHSSSTRMNPLDSFNRISYQYVGAGKISLMLLFFAKLGIYTQSFTTMKPDASAIATRLLTGGYSTKVHRHLLNFAVANNHIYPSLELLVRTMLPKLANPSHHCCDRKVSKIDSKTPPPMARALSETKRQLGTWLRGSISPILVP